jgi:putative IMPACT (imprinted ancient) family translation regulator
VRYSGKRLKLITDYTDIGKVLYILGNHGLEPESSDYGADVRLEIPVSDEVLPFLRAELTEGTAGRIRMEEGDPEWFLRVERDN